MPKVELVLSHPWRDDKNKLHEVGDRVSLDDAGLAERLISSGTALPATKSDAETAGVSDASTARSRK